MTSGEVLLQIILAVIIGGLVGAEREFRTGIGLRTMMLICLGATLITIYGNEYGILGNDPSRITAAIVTGVGFLGAGMIITHRAGVFGFTTAATVWLVAALGIGIGLGEYLIVVVSTALVLAVLWLVPYVRRISHGTQTLAYEATGPADRIRQDELISLLESRGLAVLRSTLAKSDDSIQYTWTAVGRSDDHQTVMRELVSSDIVSEFNVVLFDELN
ncbi:MAG: MgtC/SapB family protein [Acidimicrobiia bacterium]|nr:MgtC/SapB family protein [Acidimicrobiia bacterium]